MERKSAQQGRKSARYGAAIAPLLSPDVATRRARAALEYAPYEREEVQRRAAAIEPRLTPATFNRIVSRSDTRGFNSSDELEAFAAACEVPAWFLEVGFVQQEEDDRLVQIERVLEVLTSAVDLDRLGEDEALTLRSWRPRSGRPSGGTGSGSLSLEAD